LSKPSLRDQPHKGLGQKNEVQMLPSMLLFSCIFHVVGLNHRPLVYARKDK